MAIANKFQGNYIFPKAITFLQLCTLRHNSNHLGTATWITSIIIIVKIVWSARWEMCRQVTSMGADILMLWRGKRQWLLFAMTAIWDPVPSWTVCNTSHTFRPDFTWFSPDCDKVLHYHKSPLPMALGTIPATNVTIFWGRSSSARNGFPPSRKNYFHFFPFLFS